MELGVGCPMWAHKPWQGRYLPDGLARHDQLAAYATWCNAVEGNTTFYGLPAASSVEAWAASTPASFRFAFKLPRAVTHDRRLREAEAETTRFLDLLAPLGGRADPVVIQLPATFGPAQLGDLARYLASLPTSHRYAVEVRHPAFFPEAEPGSGSDRATRPSPASGALERLLRRHDVEWTIFDTTTLFSRPPTDDAERQAWTDKPRVAPRTIALTDRPVVRFLGRDDPEATARGWQRWLPIVAGWLREGRRPLFFVHTPDNVDALPLARRFHHEVIQLVPELEPLPEPRRPVRETLF